MRVVIDTNVLYSAVRSRRGASFAVLQEVLAGRVVPVISVPLCLEYEDVLLRSPTPIPAQAIHDILDYLVSVSVQQRVHVLWRPLLSDLKDDMVLEVAFNASSRHIVTHSLRDFRRSETLGIQAITPAELLTLLKKGAP